MPVRSRRQPACRRCRRTARASRTRAVVDGGHTIYTASSTAHEQRPAARLLTALSPDGRRCVPAHRRPHPDRARGHRPSSAAASPSPPARLGPGGNRFVYASTSSDMYVVLRRRPGQAADPADSAHESRRCGSARHGADRVRARLRVHHVTCPRRTAAPVLRLHEAGADDQLAAAPLTPRASGAAAPLDAELLADQAVDLAAVGLALGLAHDGPTSAPIALGLPPRIRSTTSGLSSITLATMPASSPSRPSRRGPRARRSGRVAAVGDQPVEHDAACLR